VAIAKYRKNPFKGFGVLMCFEIMVGWFCILNVKWLVDGGLKAMV